MSGGTPAVAGDRSDPRVTVTLAALGFTVVSDSYNAANTTPNIIYELVLGGILTSVFVPALVGRQGSVGAELSSRLANRFLTIRLVLLTGVAVVRRGDRAVDACVCTSGGVDDPIRRAQEIELGTFFLRWFMPRYRLLRARRAVAAVCSRRTAGSRRQMYAPGPEQPRRDRDHVRPHRDARTTPPRVENAHARREDAAGRWARRSVSWP